MHETAAQSQKRLNSPDIPFFCCNSFPSHFVGDLQKLFFVCGALRLEKLHGGKEKFTRGEEKQHGNCSSCCCSCFFFSFSLSKKPDCNYRQRFFTQRGGKSLHVRLPKCFSGKTTVVIEIKPKCHFASFFRLLKKYFSAGKCLECQSRFILF